MGQLTKRNKWCYCVGGLRDVSYQFVSMFLMVYIQFTVKLTVEQFAVLTAVLIGAKIWDAVNDPMMAAIIENVRFKSGKFRPWILVGAITNSIITAAFFLIRIDGWAFVIMFGILYVLWDMTFTMNDVGYWSMLPALSSDNDERSVLTTTMMVFTTIASFAIAAVIPMVTAEDKAARYAICAVIVVTIFLLSQLLTYFGVKEKERDLTPVAKEDSISLIKMVKIIIGNDQLMWITLVLGLYYLASGLLLQFGTNFCYFEFGYAEGGGIYTIFAVVFLVSTVASQFAFPSLVKKIKRKGVTLIGIIMATVGYVLLMMFGYVLPKSIVVIAISGFGIFAGQNLMYLCFVVQMTNTIEYNELKTGSRDESVVFSLRSFLAKLTSALQSGVVNAVLIISGIFASTEIISNLETQGNLGEITSEAVTAGAEAAIQSTPDSATLILRICMVAIPIVLLVISYFVVRAKYTITEEKYDEILAEIEARKADKGIVA